jgi:hypothetical protein
MVSTANAANSFFSKMLVEGHMEGAEQVEKQKMSKNRISRPPGSAATVLGACNPSNSSTQITKTNCHRFLLNRLH